VAAGDRIARLPDRTDHTRQGSNLQPMREETEGYRVTGTLCATPESGRTIGQWHCV